MKIQQKNKQRKILLSKIKYLKQQEGMKEAKEEGREGQ